MEHKDQLGELLTGLKQRHSVTDGLSTLKKVLRKSSMAQFGVDDFAYSCMLADGRRTYLASSEGARSAIINFIANKKYNLLGFRCVEAMHMNLHGQIILWSSHDVTSVVNDFNRFYFISYFCEFLAGSELFNFTFKDADIFGRFSYQDICHNIRKFALFFHENAKSLIQKTHNEFFCLPSPDIYIDTIFSSYNTKIAHLPNDPLISHLLSSEKKRFYVSRNTYITRKELVVIAHLINGCTAREIAGIMHLSEETIHSHYKNVKQKIGCRTALQTGAKLRELLFQPEEAYFMN